MSFTARDTNFWLSWSSPRYDKTLWTDTSEPSLTSNPSCKRAFKFSLLSFTSLPLGFPPVNKANVYFRTEFSNLQWDLLNMNVNYFYTRNKKTYYLLTDLSDHFHYHNVGIWNKLLIYGQSSRHLCIKYVITISYKYGNREGSMIHEWSSNNLKYIMPCRRKHKT